MGMALPGYLGDVLGFIGGGFTYPEGDEDALGAMSDAYAAAADALEAAGLDVAAGSAGLQSVIAGQVHDAMAAYFDQISGSEGLAGVADNFSRCSTLCRLTAGSVAVAKGAYIGTLALFAIELYAALAAAPFTFGASMGVAAGEAVITGAMLRAIITELIENIVEHIAATGLKVIVREVGIEIATEAGKEAAIGATKELSEALIASRFFGDGVDPGKVLGAAVSSGAQGAVSGAVDGVGKRGLTGPSAHPDGSGRGGGSGENGGSGDTGGSGHGDSGSGRVANHGAGSDGNTSSARPPAPDPASGTSPRGDHHDATAGGAPGPAAVPPASTGGDSRGASTPRPSSTPSSPDGRSPSVSTTSGHPGPPESATTRPPSETRPAPSEPSRAAPSQGGAGGRDGAPHTDTRSAPVRPEVETDTPEDVMSGASGDVAGEQVAETWADDPSQPPVGVSSLPTAAIDSTDITGAVIEGHSPDLPLSGSPPLRTDGLAPFVESIGPSAAASGSGPDPGASAELLPPSESSGLNLDTSDDPGSGR